MGFIYENFLLQTKTSQALYDQFCKNKSIIDYHNHLSPKDIAENRSYNNLSELWLDGDHYKWRGMRIHGIAEEFITGKASAEEKFMKWAETVPFTMRNPLFHWTHLELKNYFGIEELLNPATAKRIYQRCNEQLSQKEFSTIGLLEQMKVDVVCTTDDPTDTLEYHTVFAASGHRIKMYPTFRPDKAYATHDTKLYNTYVDQLATITQINIQNFEDLLKAMSLRMDFFNQLGCRAADHGLESLPYEVNAKDQCIKLFEKIRHGGNLTPTEQVTFRCGLLLSLCKEYHKRNWVQQFHLGVMRNNNSRLREKLGPDTGFDSIGDFSQAWSMSRFLDELDKTDELAKTILYNLNPSDNEVFATMVGNFSDGSVKGKIQYGSGWWFLDQKEGMEKQLNTLSNMGLLSHFVGMVTDSRSFLSFPRHEYFRRILCNVWGNDMEQGLVPNELAMVGPILEDICYNNSKNYFRF